MFYCLDILLDNISEYKEHSFDIFLLPLFLYILHLDFLVANLLIVLSTFYNIVHCESLGQSLIN